MRYSQFAQTIKGLPEKPVYAILCEDDYLTGLTCDAISARISKSRPQPPEKHRFFAGTTSAREALSVLMSPGFFSPSSTVIIHDVDKYGSNDATVISSYIEKPDPQSALILTAHTLDKRKSLYKKIAKSAVHLLDFKPTRDDEMADWIRAIATQKGKRIDAAAIDALIRNVGANLGIASMEVKKLISYVGDQTAITASHVEELVGRSRVDSAFDLSQAISERNATRALSVANNLLEEGESEIGLIALLRWQILRILRAKDLELGGIPRNEIPAAVGVRFYSNEFLDVLRGFDFDSARRAYLMLFDADVSLRGKAMSSRHILEGLVVSLCSS